jgi:WD40 repeat protein
MTSLIVHAREKFAQKAHEKDVNTVAVAPNDKLCASGSQDKTIKIWKTENLSLAGVLKGHKKGIWCVEFSPVDRCLASASGDRTIKLWSVADFTCLKVSVEDMPLTLYEDVRRSCQFCVARYVCISWH